MNLQKRTDIYKEQIAIFQNPKVTEKENIPQSFLNQENNKAILSSQSTIKKKISLITKE